ncbi:GtrA family protein [Patescibacteria group bacterium]|nr:GtrA family protein [Patescibacteria group bacterium]
MILGVNFEKRDIKAGIFASVLVFIFSYPTLNNIDFINQRGRLIVLAVAFAIGLLVIKGLYWTKFLSRWWAPFWQIGKFIVVGGLNTFVDFAVLNLLISLTGLTAGLPFTLFKTLAFTVAVINSYYWNKYWTFEAVQTKDKKEFLEFLIVSLVSLGVNVGTASFVNSIDPIGGLTAITWANVSALMATFTALAVNFIGYKFLVFREKDSFKTR